MDDKQGAAQLTSAMEISAEVSQPENESPLPAHLIALPGGDWALWRCIGLRGAGFPASQVLKLSSPECAAAADLLLQAEQETNLKCSQAIEALDSDLKQASEEDKATLEKEKRRLQKGKQSQLPDLKFPSSSATSAYSDAWSRLNSLKAAFASQFESGYLDISSALIDISQTGRFREAVVWQNRHALHTAIAPLLRRGRDGSQRTAKHRAHEKMIANYVQRYCVKNDTIGFFGPVGWAKFASDGETIRAIVGPELLASREVFFEGWCIDALAKRLSSDRSLLPWMAPRRLPFLHLEGTKLRGPFEEEIQLSEAQAAIFNACDGEKTAEEIAVSMIYDHSFGIRSEVEVFNFLESLRSRGLITWTFEIPLRVHAERELERLIDRIMDDRLRKSAHKALRELESGRSAIASAAGNAEKLDEAMANLESSFTRLTGVGSTRLSGITYAARTLVYEDSRRDIEVEFGPGFLESLGLPLTLLLTSARWFTQEMAAIYLKEFKKIYSDLASEAGSPTVEATKFWLRAEPLLIGDLPRPADAILPLFQSRWAEILRLGEGQRRVYYDCRDLTDPVASAFQASAPGWKYAVYNSPDIMVAASSVEDIRRDNYQLILGEFHLGTNTIGSTLFIEQHPAPQQLVESLEKDLSGPSIFPVPPRSWPRLTTRTQIGLVTSNGVSLEYSRDSSLYPNVNPVPIGELVVEGIGDDLFARTRDGAHRFDVADMFGYVFSYLSINHFRILPPSPHSPRVSFDRLIVSRESWRFSPSEMKFAYNKEEAQRFLGARRWAQTNGIPRWAFVKVPGETKPFYVDFDSPIYTDILAKQVRVTAERGEADQTISITEMLPDPYQTWLPDAEGNCYTSELRLVAVDRSPRVNGSAITRPEL